MGIGKTLLDILQEKGENPNSLAEKVGVTPSTIYSITKRDNMKVDISLLAKICSALNVSMNRFYDEYISEQKASDVLIKKDIVTADNSENDVRKQKLLNNYEKMNDTGKDKLVKYSDFMLDDPDYLKESDKTVSLNA